jgi:hypothetical protein
MMASQHARRLAKLERHGSTGDIPVWCDAEVEVPATIQAMLAEGEIAESDINRCVFWSIVGPRKGAHEQALANLMIQDGNSE